MGFMPRAAIAANIHFGRVGNSVFHHKSPKKPTAIGSSFIILSIFSILVMIFIMIEHKKNFDEVSGTDYYLAFLKDSTP
jgi:hypothetical protein